MSKSIYEEARELTTKAYNEQISFSEHDVIFIALQQAEKQEKLLELYKEKDKYTKVFTPLPKVELDKYRNIVKQIKEIENEYE